MRARTPERSSHPQGAAAACAAMADEDGNKDLQDELFGTDSDDEFQPQEQQPEQQADAEVAPERDILRAWFFYSGMLHEDSAHTLVASHGLHVIVSTCRMPRAMSSRRTTLGGGTQRQRRAAAGQ